MDVICYSSFESLKNNKTMLIEAIDSIELIESYPVDKYFPSYLV